MIETLKLCEEMINDFNMHVFTTNIMLIMYRHLYTNTQ